MPISVECKYCGKNLTVGDHVAGKRFRCPDCLEIIEAPFAVAPPEPEFRPQPAVLRPAVSQRPSRPAPPPQRTRPAPARPVEPRRPVHRSKAAERADVGAELWSFSSYDYPEAPMTVAQRPLPQDLRKTNPELFEEYDRLVNECLMFLIGLGIIVAGLFSVFYFGDSAPSDPVRHKHLFQGAMVISGGSVLAGLLCLTHSRTMLVIIAIFSAVFGAVILVLGLVFAGALLIPGLGMCLVCVRLITAVLKYPAV